MKLLWDFIAKVMCLFGLLPSPRYHPLLFPKVIYSFLETFGLPGSGEVLQFFKVIVCKDVPMSSGICDINRCHFVHLYFLGLS